MTTIQDEMRRYENETKWYNNWCDFSESVNDDMRWDEKMTIWDETLWKWDDTRWDEIKWDETMQDDMTEYL